MKNFFIQFIIAFNIFYLAASPVYAQFGTVSSSKQTISSGLPNQKQMDSKSLIDEQSQSPMNDFRNQMMMNQGNTKFLSQFNKVHIVGYVEDAGSFTVPNSTRLSEAIRLSKPLIKNPRLISIKRDGKTRYYDLFQYYFFGSLNENPFVAAEDIIKVHKTEKNVKVVGPVQRNGTFQIYREKNLRDVIRLVGGFTQAYHKDTPIKVIYFVDGDRTIEEIDYSDIKKYKIKGGETIVVPDSVNAKRTFDYTVESVPGENIVYPTSVPDVFVIGAVSVPGPYPYKSHLTVKDYIGFAGATKDAKLRRVKIFREGKKKTHKMSSNVQAGDVIIVKEKTLNETMKYVGIVSTLMSVTLTALILREQLND